MADHGNRDGNSGDKGRARAAQEDENHQHHQNQRLDHGLENRLDRLFDEDRGIHRDPRLHPGRQRSLQPRQHRFDPARNFQRVGGRLLDDTEADRFVAADTHDLAVLVRPRGGVANILQTNRIAVRRDDHIVEIFRRTQVGAGLHGEFALRALDAPSRRFDVLVEERVLDVLNGQSLRREPLPVEPDPHRVLALAADDDRRHAGQRLERVRQVAVGEIGDVHGRLAIAADRDPDDRLRIRFDLGDDGFVDGRRQLLADAGDAVADVGCRGIDFAVGQEGNRNLADFLPAVGLDGLDAFDAGQGIFQRLRYRAFDHLRRRPLVHRAHRDNGRVDVRIFAHGHARIRQESHEYDDQAHHRGQDRPLDRNFGENHRPAPG